MNKTITINLGGIVFHIEENAFEILKKYINGLKQSFATTDGKDEIIADIEARMGEMLQARLAAIREVVIDSDVNEVISVMGRPEDFSDAADNNASAGINPDDYRSYGPRKRLFRDTDDRIAAGVCAGISAYLNIDPIWLRLIFAGSFLLWGSGFILYVVLWIVMPPAKTTAEKLQMRGEEVNVENIKRTVGEEMNEVKKKFNDIADDLRKAPVGERAHDLASRIGEAGLLLGRSMVLILGKAFAGIGIVFALLGLTAVAMLALGVTMFSDVDFTLFLPMLFDTAIQHTLALISISLVIGIPLFGLLITSVCALFNIKNSWKPLRISLAALWACGILIGAYVVAHTVDNFKHKYTFRQQVTIAQPIGNTIIVDINDTLGTSNFHYSFEEDGLKTKSDLFVDELNRKVALRQVQLDIQRAVGANVELVEVKSSNGQTPKQAYAFAKAITPRYKQNDSIFSFDPFIVLDSDKDKFHNQRVRLILKIPVGKQVYLNDNSDEIIYDIENVTNTYDGDMVGHTWIMTERGLECKDCSFTSPHKDYESDKYHDDNEDWDDKDRKDKHEGRLKEKHEEKIKVGNVTID